MQMWTVYIAALSGISLPWNPNRGAPDRTATPPTSCRLIFIHKRSSFVLVCTSHLRNYDL